MATDLKIGAEVARAASCGKIFQTRLALGSYILSSLFFQIVLVQPWTKHGPNF